MPWLTLSLRRRLVTGLGPGRFPALVCLALLCPVHACAGPAELAAPKGTETSAKTPVSPPTTNPEKARQLVEAIIKVSQLPRLDRVKAAEILGTRLGAQRNATEYRMEWSLEPTQLIAEGTAVGVRGKAWALVKIAPHPSLDLAFEDFVPHLLDASYTLDARRVHLVHDSVATSITRLKHVFRIEGGEMTIEVPTTVPPETPYQESNAMSEGWNAAKGKSASRSQVVTVYFSNELGRSWRNPRTLRQFREPRKAHN
jgi:hypothetical protein